MDFRQKLESKYREILTNYLADRSEQALYQGQKLSRNAIERNIPPEEIVSIHRNIMAEMFPEKFNDRMQESFDILLEVMVAYGFAYREHQNLKHIQQELRTEMEIAANVQKTLLGTEIPCKKDMDIGAISVPAKHMNGDYFNFVEDENNSVSIAIADVIGKGLPAALCMSMIKYAMDSLPENRKTPTLVLENLNRVVEQNVDLTMFITMFYGTYHIDHHIFSYASAGHEPGLFYHAETQTFSELPAKGLLLGIEKNTKYRKYEKEVMPGDMIILMSDGVTESRTKEGFIEREELLALIEKNIHLKAQNIVQNVYKELEKLQDFQLRDDFTLIILRRNV
ncbi:PP2C family protein-serine/threonine phosphatase [Cytobacillus sp. FSL W7-1323]|uniref:Phosphoserine phosphatase n=1 Tax=Cytobacillus kochii TaxID=859143 RepID=A0A248TGC4_9BACI|nr:MULTISPECIES: PP2C family protein-serine/threonine phosphatase [Cytobacillus]ASV67246.1 phosphoserine phosphatase [Cytobacillus kochii]MCA1027920.1 PP2C family protein-serine/threonine phosphatase [Cytobacillus kochii]MCM3323831.1 PP2C family protein-serine/threonine phosphatase [Cytobacillus kochii]MCM3346228.1 PP2C family protein-serine/threonine phosphatase [Cytobacillus kochii]MDM5205914.1 PP2C family protein-serine/threonine phosphatase [Cytobacillus kochii]